MTAAAAARLRLTPCSAATPKRRVDEAAKWVRSAWVAPRLSPLLATAAEAADASLASLANVLITFVRGPELRLSLVQMRPHASLFTSCVPGLGSSSATN